MMRMIHYAMMAILVQEIIVMMMRLVLTLVELIRELLERQALRRIDGGSLTEGEVERLGETFLRLAEEIEKLREYFGFTDEDLNLNLGPLGKLR